MDIKKLQSLVIDALEDVKAQDIRLFDTVHLTSLFDRIVIASGTSNRQTKALAASVRDKVKAEDGHILSIEGETTGEWVLVDLGDMIVKEIKLGAAKRKPSTDTKITSHILGSTPTKSTASKKTSTSTSPARKTATKTVTKSSTKSASKTASKTATKTATRSPAVKKTAAKKVVAKKTVSKTAVKKTSATKSTRTASKSSSPTRSAAKKSK